MRIIFYTLLLSLLNQVILFSQAPVFEESECPATLHNTYENTSAKSGDSDRICDSGTKYTSTLIDPDGIVKSYRVIRVGPQNEGQNWAKVEINWEPNVTGTATLKIFYQRRKKKNAVACDWRAKELLCTYTLHKESSNPGGAFLGPQQIIKTSNGNEEVTFSTTFIGGLGVRKIRFYVNDEFQKEEKVNPFRLPVLTYSTKDLGDHLVTTKVQNACEDQWFDGPGLTFSLKPSCHQNNPSGSTLSLTGPELTSYPEGEKVELNYIYTVNVYDITDFDDHYELTHDGEADLTLENRQLTINSDLGTYKLLANRKGGREECPIIDPLSVFIGGRDALIEGTCLITLSEDLIDFGYKMTPGEPALQHFQATVKSPKGFIIKPGITLSKGAELILDYEEPQIDEVHELNADMNFIQTTAYDEYGYVLGQSRQYFDDLGRATQSQYKNLTEDVLMTSGVVYDAHGRAVLNTLTAPTKTGTFAESNDDCGDPVQTGAKVQFEYKPNFITGADNEPYDYAKFDGARELSPEPVGNSEPGTLGWYYSANNGSSTDAKMNEPLVASTNYPYSRTIFHHDGTEAVKTTSIPGDAFRIGGGHLGETDKEAASDDDPYLKEYFTIRSVELGLNDPVTFSGKFFKTVTTDGHGYKAVAYHDLSGNTIISLYFGDQDKPITRSYQFYNVRGQLIVSLSPNGWEQYSIDKVDFEAIDKTTYSYDVKGQIIATDEIDAGSSKFIYRKDGSIRFSQNAEQRKTGRYSYTNYDQLGRSVESGEYQTKYDDENNPIGIPFERNNPQLLLILESRDSDGGLSEDHGEKYDRIYTFYDFPDNDLPVYREQQFVHGAVSYTKNENVTVWYSYDEQGRIDWMVQEIDGLGIKTADYRYGPTGNVMEVAYQKTDIDEDFYHYYEYDADGRLSKVHTATEPLEYNKYGELTNREILSQQALYDYYLHGPLKRIELADRLQGIDFIYTASGALKGINSGDPERDPGGDNTNDEFRDDVFGMTLDYYVNDYSSPGFDTYGLTFADTELEEFGIKDQFTGNIRAQSWFSPVDNGKMKTYAYAYDKRNQLDNAVWGSTLTTNNGYKFEKDEDMSYTEEIPVYDANGNIKQLNRKGDGEAFIAQLAYHYKGNSNQLLHVTNDQELFREYEYNAIGQLAKQTIDKEDQFVKYDVSGKVLGVYNRYDPTPPKGVEAYTYPVVEYTYDDRGFRLSAINYKGTVEKSKTWYIRDARGQLLSVYKEDLFNNTRAEQIEVPVYGSGRLGLYRPNSLMGQYQYELTDHLGNVRAVIGEGTTLTYLATMESERAEKEQVTQEGYFSNIKSSPTSGSINHTPGTVTVDDQSGETETIDNPNEVVRLNNARDEYPDPIGAGIMLPVSPGDVIKMEVFAKYANFDRNNTSTLPAIADYLVSAFSLPTAGENWVSIFDVVDQPAFAVLPAWDKVDEEQPRAFLNYILYDNNFNFRAFDLEQVTEAAKIPETNPDLHSHEKLSNEALIQEAGYIYIYVSNDDQQDMDVYFDDLKVTHTLSDIVAGADYYPFGLKMDGREITREDFRFGYQGQFAEEDEETGWNSFELRMYDPVIGRFNVVDPYRVGFSPYIGMGNDPVNKIDPDGGCPKGDCPGYEEGISNSDMTLDGVAITASRMNLMEKNAYDRAEGGGFFSGLSLTISTSFGWFSHSNPDNSHFYETQWKRDFDTFAGAGANAISVSLLAPVAGVLVGETMATTATGISGMYTFAGNATIRLNMLANAGRIKVLGWSTVALFGAGKGATFRYLRNVHELGLHNIHRTIKPLFDLGTKEINLFNPALYESRFPKPGNPEL